MKKQETCTLSEAVEKIIKIQNLDITLASSKDDIKYSDFYLHQKRIELVLQLAASYYSLKMINDPNSMKAKNHLMSRRIRPETAFKFQIGYAPHPIYESKSIYSYNNNVNNDKKNNNKNNNYNNNIKSNNNDDNKNDNNINNNINSNIKVFESKSITGNLTAEGFNMAELVVAGLTIDASFYRNKNGENYKDKKDNNDNNNDNNNYDDNNDNNNNNNWKNEQYDRFRGRLMVPIKNENGVIIAFGGRTLDDVDTKSNEINTIKNGNSQSSFNENDDTKEHSSEDVGERSYQFSPENLAQIAAASNPSGKGRYTGNYSVCNFYAFL